MGVSIVVVGEGGECLGGGGRDVGICVEVLVWGGRSVKEEKIRHRNSNRSGRNP